jgi:uncharacterized protein HemY
MDGANAAYDRGDYDEARASASKVLETQPNNVRMLRILVTLSCMDGDKVAAQGHYRKLPEFDRHQMQVRCSRDYGMQLDSP